MTTFDTLGLAPPVLAGVRAAGYTALTPVQAATLPIALDGVDVVGVAQTGTGKTAAFVLPILDYLVKEPTRGRKRLIRALVVTPTRELAIQVEQSIRTYGSKAGLKSAIIYGGVGKGNQRTALRSGVDVVVATPGRLLDFMGEREIDLSHVDILVLDEADRMFDMGFLKDVRRIVAAVPEKRQTMLFSATMPPPIQELANTILYRPELVEVGNRRDPAATVAQRAVRIAEADKQALLEHVLHEEQVQRAIVFSRTKYRADQITKKLDRAGVSAVAIHSNRSQSQRQRALLGFENGDYRVLVATDLAARGIDIDGVSHVVNYDTPNLPEDYIHRIGRTGRAQATGDAITFVSSAETADFRAIEKHTGHAIEEATFDGFAPPTMADALESAMAHDPQKHGRDGRRAGGRSGGGRGASTAGASKAGAGRAGTQKAGPAAAGRNARRRPRD